MLIKLTYNSVLKFNTCMCNSSDVHEQRTTREAIMHIKVTTAFSVLIKKKRRKKDENQHDISISLKINFHPNYER